MGIEGNILQFLIACKRGAVNFGSVCTLGRQEVAMPAGQIKSILDRHGLTPPNFEQLYPWQSPPYYGEGLFQALGCSSITAMDNSAYEGASVLHDLNEPLPSHLHQQFDTVFDGGTLEHVFNVPNSFKSVMELVKVGGHFISQTAANNFCGHGFYQFSPEFMFRVFSAENGYKLKRVILYEWGASRWYEVIDPAILRKRVGVINGKLLPMLILAQRIDDKPIFAAPPMQSDYAAAWVASGTEAATAVSLPQPIEASTETRDGSVKALARKILGPAVPKISYYLNIWRLKQGENSLYRDFRLTNSQAFKPVNPGEP
jgi:SAM-dependent methyltransferase